MMIGLFAQIECSFYSSINLHLAEKANLSTSPPSLPEIATHSQPNPSSLVSSSPSSSSLASSPMATVTAGGTEPFRFPTIPREEVFLAKLEDHSIQLKVTSGNIMRMIYNLSSELDVWTMLHQLDSYINSSRKNPTTGNLPSSSSSSATAEATPSVPSQSPENHNEEEVILMREASKIMECLQESQATNAKLWTPLLIMFAISVFQWKYESLATALKGKHEFRPEDLKATECTITKLYRYERKIGEGRYSSVHIVESKQNHKFYALKKIALYSLSNYEMTTLKVSLKE